MESAAGTIGIGVARTLPAGAVPLPAWVEGQIIATDLIIGLFNGDFTRSLRVSFPGSGTATVVRQRAFVRFFFHMVYYFQG
jgi:hypothetical protein